MAAVATTTPSTTAKPAVEVSPLRSGVYALARNALPKTVTKLQAAAITVLEDHAAAWLITVVQHALVVKQANDHRMLGARDIGAGIQLAAANIHDFAAHAIAAATKASATFMASYPAAKAKDGKRKAPAAKSAAPIRAEKRAGLALAVSVGVHWLKCVAQRVSVTDEARVMLAASAEYVVNEILSIVAEVITQEEKSFTYMHVINAVRGDTDLATLFGNMVIVHANKKRRNKSLAAPYVARLGGVMQEHREAMKQELVHKQQQQQEQAAT